MLGGAMAKGLHQAGARVAIAGRGEEKLGRRVEELAEEGVQVFPVQLDCSEHQAISEAVEKIEADVGPIDILVSAAGGNMEAATVFQERPFFDIPAESFREVIEGNLMAGAVLPCQVVGEKMARGNRPGSMITITSSAAQLPLTGVVGYSAAKAAVTNFTQWLSVYFARDLRSPVRVNSIMPGFFLTEQNRYLLLDNGELTERGRAIIDQTPMNRFGNPDELIGAVVYLASDASSFVTGSVLSVDGGFTAFNGV